MILIIFFLYGNVTRLRDPEPVFDIVRNPDPISGFMDYPSLWDSTMVLIIEGTSEHFGHDWTATGNFICLSCLGAHIESSCLKLYFFRPISHVCHIFLATI